MEHRKIIKEKNVCLKRLNKRKIYLNNIFHTHHYYWGVRIWSEDSHAVRLQCQPLHPVVSTHTNICWCDNSKYGVGPVHKAIWQLLWDMTSPCWIVHKWVSSFPQLSKLNSVCRPRMLLAAVDATVTFMHLIGQRKTRFLFFSVNLKCCILPSLIVKLTKFLQLLNFYGFSKIFFKTH